MFNPLKKYHPRTAGIDINLFGLMSTTLYAFIFNVAKHRWVFPVMLSIITCSIISDNYDKYKQLKRFGELPRTLQK